jgi:hypothetical protein
MHSVVRIRWTLSLGFRFYIFGSAPLLKAVKSSDTSEANFMRGERGCSKACDLRPAQETTQWRLNLVQDPAGLLSNVPC